MHNGKRNKKIAKVLIEPGSGNVFRDLNVPNPDEALAKAELVQRITDIINERNLTQKQAAAILGIDQPKVSSLLRGKFDGYSTERLFRFLNSLGQDVEIVVGPSRARNKQASTRVVKAS
jgi:predicted XRE-type DNA-binding protein